MKNFNLKLQSLLKAFHSVQVIIFNHSFFYLTAILNTIPNVQAPLTTSVKRLKNIRHLRVEGME